MEAVIENQEKNMDLIRYVKLVAGSKGIEYSPLYDLISAGNIKIPSSTGIFNMGSAHDCPSKRLGLCQAVDKNGRSVCYAMKAERSYHPETLPFRRRQEKYWKNTSAEQFVVDFLSMNALKVSPFNALRFNASGDFWSQACVDKAESIARMLKYYGVKVYCYTARRDLDFSKCRNIIIHGSNFMTAGLRGVFKMVYSLKERPAGFGVCGMSCKVCHRCLIGRKTVVVKH